MKTLGTIILFILLFTSMGYIVIEWHHTVNFENLCKNNPALKECPKQGLKAL